MLIYSVLYKQLPKSQIKTKIQLAQYLCFLKTFLQISRYHESEEAITDENCRIPALSLCDNLSLGCLRICDKKCQKIWVLVIFGFYTKIQTNECIERNSDSLHFISFQYEIENRQKLSLPLDISWKWTIIKIINHIIINWYKSRLMSWMCTSCGYRQISWRMDNLSNFFICANCCDTCHRMNGYDKL